ncbi:TPA: cupin domain-containing protein [archaeon]|uniref:Cupin domain-containing protein n=1 Tax=Candidatus Naiadarchaeum limnaeum TaxID=2756139 RepID=A0A832V0T3_9ARCH|nr:cupin domain-containing protein [Candidatus Naiadarchaeales archaeon SRR2090153.bin1042]HIK00784.1 cupin domain-containing protein [Candidatus Naiadarchaeum limnaeum]
MGSRKSKRSDKKVIIKKPWGFEDHVLIKDGFCVKRLVFWKGRMSSFHKHKKKGEVFFIRRGMVRVRFKIGARIYKKGQFLYLPKGTLHQIINVGKSTLEIIEFSYPYVSKDVFRFEDPWAKLRKQKKLA